MTTLLNTNVPQQVLLVDDEPAILQALVRTLRRGAADGL